MARKRTAQIVTATYLITAAFVLLQFLLSPPDGLSNVWIAVWTLPVTLAGMVLLYWPFGVEFPFVPFPGSLGYYGSHTVYFTPAVLLISACFFRLMVGRKS
jgi:hypothetical protein